MLRPLRRVVRLVNETLNWAETAVVRIERRPECSRPVDSPSRPEQLGGLAGARLRTIKGRQSGELVRVFNMYHERPCRPSLELSCIERITAGALAKPPRSSHRLVCFYSTKQTCLRFPRPTCGSPRT